MQNKNLRKALAVSMAIAMTGGLLAGCGNSSSGGSSNSGTTNSGSTSSASGELDTSEFVELSMYVISDRPSGQDEIDENLNKLLKEKLNCSLKINWIGWAEYANKYPLLFSSGEEFDMAYSATWLNFASLAQKGAFKSLDELWPKYAPKNFERQSEAALRQATVEGHYYCIPTLLATYSAYGPIYRTDILEGTDWDGKMENLADFEAYLGYVKKTAPQFEPYNVMQSGSEVDDMYMREQGMYAVKGATNDFLFIDPNETDPKIFTYYEYEKTPDFLEMMNRWNEAGYFTKSALSDTDSQKFKNGIAASTIHNIDSYSGNYIDHPDWGVKYANFVKDVYNMPFTQDTVVISNTSENPERALALYDLITNDEEAFRAFYYGIEDTSYEIIDGQIKNLDADNYAFSACWAARTTEFNLDSYGAPADLKTFKDGFDEYIKEKNGEGGAKYAGFAINTSSIETEYAACQNVHQQYWWPLELGYTDAESGLKDYQAKMEAAGIEKVREVIQGQLEEYIASLA